MKLHYHPVSTTSRSVTFFCADQGIPLDLVTVDLMTGEHVKEPYISKINPSKQVPVLEDDGGFLLSECSAILKYIADKTNSPTYPKDLKARARVNEVMDWFNTNLYREYGYHLVYPQVYDGHKRPGGVQEGTVDWGKTKSAFWIGVLENHWLAGGKKFVAGDSLTIADYLGATILSCGDLVGVSFAKFPNTDKWMKAMRDRPGWSKTSEVHDGFAASLKGKPFEAIT